MANFPKHVIDFERKKNGKATITAQWMFMKNHAYLDMALPYVKQNSCMA